MKTTTSFLDRLMFATLVPRDWILHLLCWRYSTFLWGFSVMQPRLMALSRELRSRRASHRATKNFPAYAEPSLARLTRSFCLSLEEQGAQVRPCFLFEIETEPTEDLRKQFAEATVHRLAELNADFREALHEYAESLQPEIKLYRVGEGPFAANSGRIKQVRLVRSVA